LAQIKFLEQAGFSRVILARELSLSEIAEIRKNTKVELEFFVHGALCVSYSGQCYLSQALRERSANRGACAQMCRLPYTLLDGDEEVLSRNQHLLSLKDFDASSHPELQQVHQG
jgi:putative protease